MKKVDGDIQAETHQVMKNMDAILKNAGCDFSNGKKLDISTSFNSCG